MSKKIHNEQDTAELKSMIGPRMRAARKSMGITQEDAAGSIGISAEFYARMERGHALPSVVTLAKIANALNVTIDHLFGVDTSGFKKPPIPPPSAPKDTRQVSRIVDRARRDPELRRLITALLKLCERGPVSD